LLVPRALALSAILAASLAVGAHTSHIAPQMAIAARASIPGKLAYVHDGSLYVLDGATHTIRRLTHKPSVFAPNDKVLSPTWSHDGRWLAYVLTDGSSSRVWIRRADGSAARAVTPDSGYSYVFGWSSTSDVLAVAPQYAARGGIKLVSPQGSVHVISPGLGVESLVWAPGGTELAFTSHIPAQGKSVQPDALYLVHVSNLHVTREYTLQQRDGSFMRIAAWWPDGKGVLYWLDPMGSASIAADGMQLYTLRWRGKPKPLLTSLGYGDWVTVSGGKALVVQGDYRSSYDHKWLALCMEATGSCQTLVRPRDKIAVDPAWQPGGGEIAFVQARALASAGGFTHRYSQQQWLNSHALWVASPTGSGANQIRGVGGDVHAPVWSRDGRGMLFVRHNALWFDSHVGAANAVKVAQLFQDQSAANYPGPNWSLYFYGHMDWHMLFDWYQS
jgi:TolB protein